MLPYLLIGAAGVTGYVLFSSKSASAQTAQAQAASNAALGTHPSTTPLPPGFYSDPSQIAPPNPAAPNDGSWGGAWGGSPLPPVQGGGTGALPGDGNWYGGLPWSGLASGYQGQPTGDGQSFFDPMSQSFY